MSKRRPQWKPPEPSTATRRAVTEALPEKQGEYRIWFPDGGHSSATWTGDHWWGWNQYPPAPGEPYDRDIQHPTHWDDIQPAQRIDL